VGKSRERAHVSLDQGKYRVTEIQPEAPAGLIALPPVFSSGCTGFILHGQECSCNITNQFVFDTLSVGNIPVALEFSPANNNIYVANFGSGDIPYAFLT
jgi:DNA-binding beta-propeller fold protein YncE